MIEETVVEEGGDQVTVEIIKSINKPIDNNNTEILTQICLVSTNLDDFSKRLTRIENLYNKREHPGQHHRCGIITVIIFMILSVIMSIILYSLEAHTEIIIDNSTYCYDTVALSINRFSEVLSIYTSLFINTVLFSTFIYNWKYIFFHKQE